MIVSYADLILNLEDVKFIKKASNPNNNQKWELDVTFMDGNTITTPFHKKEDMESVFEFIQNSLDEESNAPQEKRAFICSHCGAPNNID
jgi:hypothetical protein